MSCSPAWSYILAQFSGAYVGATPVVPVVSWLVIIWFNTTLVECALVRPGVSMSRPHVIDGQLPHKPHQTPTWHSHTHSIKRTQISFSLRRLNAILIFYLRFLLLSILSYDFSSPRNCPVCKIWTARWTSVQVFIKARQDVPCTNIKTWKANEVWDMKRPIPRNLENLLCSCRFETYAHSCVSPHW